nr:unnamed protein product [Callosobruchus analis]
MPTTLNCTTVFLPSTLILRELRLTMTYRY